MSDIRYVHTNIVAEEWQSLAAFYESVLGCKPVPPERNLSGEWLTDLTDIPDVHIRGVHLALPGYSEGGPTLEIFSYEPAEPADRLHFCFRLNQRPHVLLYAGIFSINQRDDL